MRQWLSDSTYIRETRLICDTALICTTCRLSDTWVYTDIVLVIHSCTIRVRFTEIAVITYAFRSARLNYQENRYVLYLKIESWITAHTCGLWTSVHVKNCSITFRGQSKCIRQHLFQRSRQLLMGGDHGFAWQTILYWYESESRCGE
jgi:hypothetical protein